MMLMSGALGLAACTPVSTRGFEKDTGRTDTPHYQAELKALWANADPWSNDDAKLRQAQADAPIQVFGRIRGRTKFANPPDLYRRGGADALRYSVVGLVIEIDRVSGSPQGVVYTRDGESGRGFSARRVDTLKAGDLTRVYVRYLQKDSAFSAVEAVAEGDWFWGAFHRLPERAEDPYKALEEGRKDFSPIIWTQGLRARKLGQR